MFNWFNKKTEEAPKEQKQLQLKPVNYSAEVILLWAKAVDGDKLIQLGLRESGFPELFHATNAIYLIQESRDWLMDNGFAHLMAMINAAEGMEKAQAWLFSNQMELLYHMGRAVDHEMDSWDWLGKHAPPDIFILTKSIQVVKDQIEETHREIHYFGKD